MASASGQKLGVREVAAAAGVSFSTAAAALRGEAWVKAGTRAKVGAVAARLGYRRDPAASILASRRAQGAARSVSVVYISAMFGAPAPGRFERRLRNLGKHAKARGLQFERIELRDAAHARQVERRLIATGVEGVILGPVDPVPFFAGFAVGEFTLVADNRGLALHGVDAVRANHFAAVQRLLHRLMERGYQRVGVILRCHLVAHADDYARYGGVMAFRDMVAGLDILEVVRWPFYQMDSTAECQRKKELSELDRWQRKHRFDVIVGFDESERLMVDAACSERRHRPDYAAMAVRSEQRGRLAGIAHDQDALLEPMLNRLLEKVRGRQRGLSVSPVETVIDLPFLDGTSLRRRGALL
jgi:LacI family transcriptional regulator